MATLKIEDRVLKAREKLAKVKAENLAALASAKVSLTKLEREQQKAEKARLAAVAESARKADDHRKFIFGLVALHAMDTQIGIKAIMTKVADSYLTKPVDRAFFGLAPLPASASKDAKSDS